MAAGAVTRQTGISSPDGRLALRSCLGRFATGVTVATVEGPDGYHGLTVNSFTGVSLEPPLVLVSIGKEARGHDLFAGRSFGVNVLGAEQERLARHFAGQPQADPIRWERGTSSPRLVGALAYLACDPWAAHDAGDHTLYVGKVTRFDCRGGGALGYVCGRFVPLEEPVLGIEFLF